MSARKTPRASSSRSKATQPVDVGAALLRAYAASARANEYLVERLDPAVWRAKPPYAKMRPIAALVSHMHNCGLVYVQRAAPSLSVPPELDRFEVTQVGAVRALKAKRRSVLAALEPALARGGRVGGSPHDAAGFLAYYMVHDAHHRGQILMLTRMLGHPVSIDTMSGIWQWGPGARGGE
jgi:uncharacterized damage-inducible protein DinB